MSILAHRRTHHRPAPLITNGLIHRWAMDEGAGTVVTDPFGARTGTFVDLDPGTAWTTGPDSNPAVDFAVNGHIALVAPINLATVCSFTWTGFLRNINSLIIGYSVNNHPAYVGAASVIRVRVAGLAGALPTALAPFVNLWARFGLSRAPGGDVQLYVNGLLQDTVAYTPTQPLLVQYMGGLPDTTLRLNGTVQDVRIYDRVLSADEFLAIGTNAG